MKKIVLKLSAFDLSQKFSYQSESGLKKKEKKREREISVPIPTSEDCRQLPDEPPPPSPSLTSHLFIEYKLLI